MISPHEQPTVQWGSEPNNNYYNYYNPQCYVLPNPSANQSAHTSGVQSPEATQPNSPYAPQSVQQPATHLHPDSALSNYYSNYDHFVPSYMPPTSISYRPREYIL